MKEVVPLTMSFDMADLPTDTFYHKRAKEGALARFLHWALPKDPRARFVFPFIAHNIVTAGGKKTVLRYLPVALVLMAGTIGMVLLLLQVPGMNQSVVSLLTQAFELVLPRNWAVGAAWGVGMLAVMNLGSLTYHDRYQAEFDRLPASKNWFYGFWLRAALWEEMIFRAGAEKWSWIDRIRASLIFGSVHIINIWYSFAAGLALSLTGFAFMLVYLWVYGRTKSQVRATAVAGTVHALYNSSAIVLLCVALTASIFV